MAKKRVAGGKTAGRTPPPRVVVHNSAYDAPHQVDLFVPPGENVRAAARLAQLAVQGVFSQVVRAVSVTRSVRVPTIGAVGRFRTTRSLPFEQAQAD